MGDRPGTVAVIAAAVLKTVTKMRGPMQVRHQNGMESR
jgi:hypothetical protein